MSLSLSIVCPSMGQHEKAVVSWQDTMGKPRLIKIYDEIEGDSAGFLTKCERARHETDADVIGYLHADLFILEHDWDARILAEFDDPSVAIIGFVGATRLASEDIYKIPYHFTQLARADVWSNLSDWEVHGAREIGSKQVAVIDSCAVFIRRSLLDRLNGWPCSRYPNSSHCSDLWLCCSAARLALSVRMVGVTCTHRSGGKGAAGASWLDARGGDSALHQRAHELIYDDFRDVLPICV